VPVDFCINILFEETQAAIPNCLYSSGGATGPHALQVFNNVNQTAAVGEVGILLLMFFLGMEINVPGKQSQLVMPLTAQGSKMVLGFCFSLLVGLMADWSLREIIIVSVLFIFNSTAVVSEYLKRNGEL
jgi:CPA2 family monovalent cation:H+ antiporter-2